MMEIIVVTNDDEEKDETRLEYIELLEERVKNEIENSKKLISFIAHLIKKNAELKNQIKEIE
jgi:hypothetical protein